MKVENVVFFLSLEHQQQQKTKLNCIEQNITKHGR